ncbi:M23 family metallopeptidase [Hazenella coriacea]|uniref:SH3 domain-containing protein n=1 Tax=Hazenella coriacea TaxID=1179467 RepID=A0A4R3L3V2_9BACL|nr:M23 family metallopeptidase [Hazenella coriacea]TCS93952.1 SH3 domain-containing protein [Hazenella coriacea]
MKKKLSSMFVICLVAILVLFGTAFPMQTVSAAPSHKMPVPCNETWRVATWTGHNPANAADLNWGSGDDDLGKPVLASAAGTVKLVRDLGNTSYGKYIIIDHGGGYETLYAHLKAFKVSQGQTVSQGQQIGEVGKSGTSSAHLHYEQRSGGSVVKIVLEGKALAYPSAVNIKSTNCGGTQDGYPGRVQTNGANLNVRSGPGTTYDIVGSLANGTSVTISCQTYGEYVDGYYGRSNLWNKIGSGKFIPDAYTYTGSNGQIAPTCK